MHCLLVGFQLCTGVDGLALASVCILMHDGNNRTLLCVNDTSSCDNRDFIDPMVVNALNINTSTSLRYDAHIIPCNTPIGSTVNKGTFVTSCMARGYTVKGACHVHLSIDGAVEVDLLRLCRFGLVVGRR